MAKGKTRRKKIASSLRAIIAANVKARAKEVFPDSRNLPVDIANASKSAKVNPLVKSTVQRIMAGDEPHAKETEKTSATLEQIEALAEALGLTPYQLLIPSLDPENPQVAKGATTDERELYKRIAREAVEEALSRSTPGISPAPKIEK